MFHKSNREYNHKIWYRTGKQCLFMGSFQGINISWNDQMVIEIMELESWNHVCMYIYILGGSSHLVSGLQPWWFQWDKWGQVVHKNNWGELTHLRFVGWTTKYIYIYIYNGDCSRWLGNRTMILFGFNGNNLIDLMIRWLFTKGLGVDGFSAFPKSKYWKIKRLATGLDGFLWVWLYDLENLFSRW